MKTHLVRVVTTATGISAAIRSVLPAGASKRFVLSAFVGEGAATMLPGPRGIRVFCRLQAPGTHPDAIAALLKAGAKVFEVPSLHMKVYGSPSHGAVVGSANLTRPALEGVNLEAVVCLPPGAVPFNKVVAELESRAKPVSAKRLAEYRKEYARCAPSLVPARKQKRKNTSFRRSKLADELHDEYTLNDEESVAIRGRNFVFTGVFEVGTQVSWRKTIERKGGYSGSNVVSASTDYLVVGSKGSLQWIKEKYGRKIQKAVQLRKETGWPHIISEERFRHAQSRSR